MAVVAVEEDRAQRTARRSLTGGTEYSRSYHVEFGAETGPHYCFGATVAGGGAVRIPDVGDTHPDNSLATVRDVVPTLTDGTDRHYVVAVRYSTAAEGETPVTDDPLDEPAQYRWRRESEEREYAWSWPIPDAAINQLPPGISIDGDTGRFPVVKSNLRPFDPSRTRQYSSDVFSVTWNTTSAIPFELRDDRDVVNSDSFSIMRNTITPLTFGAGTTFLVGVGAEFLQRSGMHYWATTVEFAYRPYQFHQQYQVGGALTPISGWDDLVEAWGFLQFDSPDPSARKLEQVLIATPDGGKAEPPEPVALNRLGQWVDDPRTVPSVASQFVHWLRPYRRLAFSGIGMP